MDKKLLDVLVCPVTKTPLEYNKETNELFARASGLAYPVRDDIPVLLEKVGIDPALASGAFVTTVTDVVGFFAFLALAGAVLL